jgi:hypothetical protein
MFVSAKISLTHALVMRGSSTKLSKVYRLFRKEFALKISSRQILLNKNASPVTEIALQEITESISKVTWPPSSDSFKIHPQSGKKRGEGNGVKPIKENFIINLQDLGWTAELPFPLKIENSASQLGAMDAGKVFTSPDAFCAVEWETGNISSSHRALNKLCLGLAEGIISVGVLIVPTAELAKYLTDRIGNLRELIPYFGLWSKIQIKSGYLEIIAVEHDSIDMNVEKIPKGTDGRNIK